jgi:hypothetical protein
MDKAEPLPKCYVRVTSWDFFFVLVLHVRHPLEETGRGWRAIGPWVGTHCHTV